MPQLKIKENLPLLLIVGPSASGKTRLAIDVAKFLGGEIVNADSQQVYRHFDIGTAKPTASELNEVTHHLISCVDPTDSFSAAHFQHMADVAIADIHARGKHALVVGGTGLYLRVLLHGVLGAPGRNDALRAQFEALANREGNAALLTRLHQVDGASAARIPERDRVRIIRALEINALTGMAASAQRAAHGFADNRYQYTMWVLDPHREALHAAVNARCKAMFETGLIEETASLIASGYRDSAPMKALGYTQALDCLEGRMTREEAIIQTAQATRRFTKRQRTWFKREKEAHWIRPPYDVMMIAQNSIRQS